MEFINEIIKKIWQDRYRKNGETLNENLWRVANYCGKNEQEKNDFYNVMDNGLFFPAGRTMSNSGIGSKLTLNNCFVAPQVQDNYEDIYDKVKLGAITHQRGGGIGYDFSQLRPLGSPTTNEAIASGPVSFMTVFNSQTETTIQGQRRGANMGVISIYHMDIETFINAKANDAAALNHFNLSVMVDNDFITAVKNSENIWLHHPVYDKDGRIENNRENWIYSKEVSAKELWDQIIQKAYDNGEPGIFFYDNLNKDNNLWYIENIVCSNPCAEYLAGTVYGNNPITGEKLNSAEFGGACNLGSLFLHNFIKNPFKKDAYLDFELLSTTIHTAVKMLDNIIDINVFPNQIYENYQKNFRTIGLGVTGLADALAMLGLKYNTLEARKYVDSMMDFISYNAYHASVELAKERGSFPFLDREKFVQSGYLKKHCVGYLPWDQLIKNILQYGIRNAKILSVAPVGTLSLTFGNNCSSGLEPIFSLEYDRKVKIGGQTDDKIKVVKMQDYAYGLWKQVKDDPETVVGEDVFVTALEMSVNDHVDMLGVIAKHVDMSCSKTINVPEDYSFEDTKNIYMKCHELGIKGCTIFRPNAIRQGVLLSGDNKEPVKTHVDIKSYELPRGMIIKADDNCIGKKRTLHTGCGTLHCEAFFDPDTGELLETYLSKGSSGGCNNFMIGLSRLISLAARGGIDIYSIVDQLKSSGTCPSYAVRTATKHDTSKGSSCPVAIGNALLEMYKEMQGEVEVEEEIVKFPITSTNIEAIVKTNASICPECGEDLIFEGGCNTCKSCGYSKCN